MKTVFATLLLATVVQAFNAPMMATRAIKKAPAKKALAKKALAKKAAAKTRAVSVTPKAPPASKGYPTLDVSGFKFKGISGGGNKAPPAPLPYPDFSNPAKQIARDPAFYAAAAATRGSKSIDYVIDDGLTVLERKQRLSIPEFLSGSAKSQADVSTIRDDVEADELIFGLDADRFQLLFIAVFGVLTLVGCLSGNIKL